MQTSNIYNFFFNLANKLDSVVFKMSTTKKFKNTNKPSLRSIFSNADEERRKAKLFDEITQRRIDDPSLKKVSVQQNMSYEDLYYTYMCLTMSTTNPNTSDKFIF